MNRSDTAATQAFAQELGRFVSQSPSSFHAAATVKASLIDQGFLELDESEAWTSVTAGGRYVVTRDGSVIAFVVPDTAVSTTALRIFGAHTDSPALKLKPKSSITSHGFNQVGVEVYGGALFNSFLDRDLKLAGRIVLMDGEEVLVHTGPYLRVPQLAVHLDRAVNRDGLTLDAQKHLQPITGLAEGGEHDVLADLAAIAGINPQHIAGYDIVTVDAQEPQLIGARREFLASARLDNLLSTFAGLEAIKAQDASANDHISLFIANDHEEVGSASRSGAAGPFLEDVLARLYSALGASDEERRRAFNRSIVVSSDVGHSVHPNYPERHDPANQPIAGKGPILKINADQRYATDARGAAFWARACAHAGIEYQEFVSNNSMPCGSTIGPITATRLGMTTVDVGVPILSMHSCRELTAVSDPYDLYLAATAVFSPEVSSIP
ncbi:M18 family aminopeptidase [Dermabacter hominis]|uniref:M18 family aminopeptidase n=1 Tax=Dermabacter hominis TaxID=36740 RepID=UPI0021A93BD8|nr:M18 family aminopeptidase [Dermabacter hominis]MCT1789034.1 M18 family aminopeptidase [Dermabacter hominis]MCT2055104.1 M18 family aminopeptidase [Dermabacter hominis]MCT2083301.1 M18 family aminopeptidase [Dermabacter hominis]MCT2090879.1 M18 family aminopeptidase [Dermabacter hominis]MCT2189522.1 M18 family aminopeptidase [Dermabacter hominis]